MKSAILTKINKVTIAFKDQITELKGKGDYSFLQQFVKHAHKNFYTVNVSDDSISVHTSQFRYLYRIYPKYISRVNLDNQSKIFYKIS